MFSFKPAAIHFVIPANAGIQASYRHEFRARELTSHQHYGIWIPAFAGMTKEVDVVGQIKPLPDYSPSRFASAIAAAGFRTFAPEMK